MILRSLLAAVVLFAAFGASAQPAPVTNSRMVPAQVQPGADAALDERQAREWGLRSEEWARYRQLMQGPLGVYSRGRSPGSQGFCNFRSIRLQVRCTGEGMPFI